MGALTGIRFSFLGPVGIGLPEIDTQPKLGCTVFHWDQNCSGWGGDRTEQRNMRSLWQDALEGAATQCHLLSGNGCPWVWDWSLDADCHWRAWDWVRILSTAGPDTRRTWCGTSRIWDELSLEKGLGCVFTSMFAFKLMRFSERTQFPYSELWACSKSQIQRGGISR